MGYSRGHGRSKSGGKNSGRARVRAGRVQGRRSSRAWHVGWPVDSSRRRWKQFVARPSSWAPKRCEVKARKPSDLSPCTPYASDSGGSFVTPQFRRTASVRGSFVNPGSGELLSLRDFVIEAARMMGGGPHRCWLRPVPFTASQGGSLLTPELKIDGGKVPAKRRKHGGGSALGLRSVPFTSEAPGGRPRSGGGGGSEELPHELMCDCDRCLNG